MTWLCHVVATDDGGNSNDDATFGLFSGDSNTY